jgi:hypothetical protein
VTAQQGETSEKKETFKGAAKELLANSKSKSKQWFVKTPLNRKRYKVASINLLKGQRVLYQTYPKGLAVRYFT